MNDNIISVTLWGKEVCQLRWIGGYRQRFGKVGSLISFNREYVSYNWDLDPIGPYNRSIYLVQHGMSDYFCATQYNGLPRFLSGCLPDDWGNSVFNSWAKANNISINKLTPVDRLAYIGKRGMGALEFVPALYEGISKDDNLVVEELYSLARQIQQSRESYSLDLAAHPGISELMAVGTSAGGMHPKAIVAINWNTEEVKSGQFLLPPDFTQYILKFCDTDKWPSAEMEYVYYQMATKSGITMEKCRLLPIEGRNHFLTERFDRKDGDKIHSATLQSLNGTTYSYEEIMGVCRKMNLPHQDTQQLFRRAVFNFLSGVCDDHDKNFSFIMSKDGKWSLSPAYDVTFTVDLWNPFIGNRHYMTLSGQERTVNKEQLLEFASDNDISNASDIIGEVIEALSSFRQLATDSNIENVFIAIVEEFINSQIKAL